MMVSNMEKRQSGEGNRTAAEKLGTSCLSTKLYLESSQTQGPSGSASHGTIIKNTFLLWCQKGRRERQESPDGLLRAGSWLISPRNVAQWVNNRLFRLTNLTRNSSLQVEKAKQAQKEMWSNIAPSIMWNRDHHTNRKTKCKSLH